MALSKAALSTLMQTKIGAISGITISNPTELANFCDAIAEAVVTHITGSGVVVITSLIGAVTSGAGAGGATTSSGTATIT